MLKDLLKSHNIVATKQRLEVFEILHNSKEYLSAYDLSDRIEGLDISTVYRTLNLFDDQKIVSKKFNESQNAFTYKYIAHKHYHYLRCIKCDKVIEIDFCPMNVLDPEEVEMNNFMITDYKFEIYGYCEACRA